MLSIMPDDMLMLNGRAIREIQDLPTSNDKIEMYDYVHYILIMAVSPLFGTYNFPLCSYNNNLKLCINMQLVISVLARWTLDYTDFFLIQIHQVKIKKSRSEYSANFVNPSKVYQEYFMYRLIALLEHPKGWLAMSIKCQRNGDSETVDFIGV